ncbi:MAG: hypothetical protein J6Y28_07460 [Acholeplasmatales bacterium]|nr:hypothetical protein [Acholeplasmatales bacterium]
MKYNEKQFYQSTTEPFETQEMSNGAKIELHYMNEEPFFNECINKARFSSWASGDGKNYKLFIEKGLYDETSELYSKEVNEVWIDFWKRIDLMRKRYIFFIMLPMLAIFLTAFILMSILIPNQIWGYIVALVVVLVSSLVASSMLSKKMQIENINAAARVRDHIGVEKFKVIVDTQEKYIEKFYEDLQKKYEEEDRLAEEQARLDEMEAEANNKKAEEADLEDAEEVLDAEVEEAEETKEE